MRTQNSATLLGFRAKRGGPQGPRQSPPHGPPLSPPIGVSFGTQPDATGPDPGASGGALSRPPSLGDGRPLHVELDPTKLSKSGLGSPLTIRQVAKLIGCSPWTVRQTLIPRGLPHFRFTASGRLTFYTNQVIRWIEKQQIGG